MSWNIKVVGPQEDVSALVAAHEGMPVLVKQATLDLLSTMPGGVSLDFAGRIDEISGKAQVYYLRMDPVVWAPKAPAPLSTALTRKP